MATPNERLATLEQRLTDHESRCEERLGEIKTASAATLRAVEGLKARAWGVVAALMTWALAQLWSDNAQHLKRLDAVLPVAKTAWSPPRGVPEGSGLILHPASTSKHAVLEIPR